MKSIHSCYTPIVLIIFFGFLTNGCGTQYYPLKSKLLHEYKQDIFVKNYKLDTQQEAYVGESIVKIKEYSETKRVTTGSRAFPSNDFCLGGGLLGWSQDYCATKEEPIDIRGLTKWGDKEYLVLIVPNKTHQTFWIDKETKQNSGILATIDGATVGLFKSVVTPEDTTFDFEVYTKSEINIEQGFNNYEILFTGTTKDSISLLYREYTPEDLAKAAFYQSLTYPIGSKHIRFKDIRIKIIAVTSEKITYKVLEDGLQTPQ